MTKYYKTGTITAEPFDGSFDMMDKYGIRKEPLEVNTLLNASDSEEALSHYLYRTTSYLIPTLEGYRKIHKGDMIVTGAECEHWAVRASIFSKTYEALPLIPHDIAREIERLKQNEEALTSVIGAAYQDALVLGTKHLTSVDEYILYVGDTFITAWTKGYQVA